MYRLKTFSIIAAIFFTTAVYGKGHGHGGGGHHGGGHSGSRNSGGQSSEAKGPTKPAKAPARRMNVQGRNTGVAGTNGRIRYVQLPAGGTYRQPAATVYENYYPGYMPYSYGYGSPYFNYGYYNMLSIGAGIGYTPNYGYMPPPAYSGYGGDDGYNNNSRGTVEDELEGFVVYARDTLNGRITLKANSISLEKTDSGRNYDYKFKHSQKQLTAVRVTNEDNKQLELVRIKDDAKRLWRLIHDGKLNLYDQRNDFIYRPEDIDTRSLVAVYNGNVTHLNSSSLDEAKERLTVLVNTAYDLKLDPAKFTWRELLIYIDKLDYTAQ